MARTVAAPAPLTGRYAVQGAQMRAGVELWARRAGVRVEVVDDESKPERAARIHEELAAHGCHFVLGPYGSDSTRAVAEARAGSAVWNHGAAAEDVQRLPGVVSVATPASRYLLALGRVVAELRPGVAAALVTAPGRLARFARQGLERSRKVLGGLSPGLAAFPELLPLPQRGRRRSTRTISGESHPERSRQKTRRGRRW